MTTSNPRVAYMEEAQEDTGSSIEGDEKTRTYATSQAAPPQRPNTGRSRESRPPPAQRSGSSSASPDEAETDSTTRSSKQRRPTEQSSSHRDLDQRTREHARRRRERPAVDGNERAKTESSRTPREAQKPRVVRPPGPQHAATQPVIHYQSGYARPPAADDASYYGIQPAMSGTARPGNRRPASYYAGQPSRPPVSNPSWHHPPPFPVGTFPPPMFPPSPMMHAPMAPPPPPSGLVEPQGYFDPSLESSVQSRDRLKARFQQRPSSAMGGRPPSSMGFPPPDYEEPMGRPIARRPSQSGRRERERDRQDMPPPTWIPQRSNSAMPATTPFRPPPQTLQPSPLRQQRPNQNRRSVGFVDQQRRGFTDDDLIGEEDLFHDISPQPPRMRPQRGSVSYDHSDYELVLANGRNSRRSSLHGSAAVSGGGASLEDDYVEAAMRYQDRMNGGKIQVPLTEKVLREASKRGGVPSSRSTRSSASHDDSEYYKRSNTTGFTRSSGGGPDDYKIKVSGAAIVRASGLEIECDGGEITFSAPSRSRSGSDRGSTIFPQIEDAQSRMGPRALPYRGRTPSQSDSQSRGYAPTHAPYEPHLANNFF